MGITGCQQRRYQPDIPVTQKNLLFRLAAGSFMFIGLCYAAYSDSKDAVEDKKNLVEAKIIATKIVNSEQFEISREDELVVLKARDSISSRLSMEDFILLRMAESKIRSKHIEQVKHQLGLVNVHQPIKDDEEAFNKAPEKVKQYFNIARKNGSDIKVLDNVKCDPDNSSSCKGEYSITIAFD